VLALQLARHAAAGPCAAVADGAERHEGQGGRDQGAAEHDRQRHQQRRDIKEVDRRSAEHE
jgi:hypothetical protein